MDQTLKQRLVGVALLTAVAFIFVPMLFDDPVEDSAAVKTVDVPEFPAEFESRAVPIPPQPEGGMPLSEAVPETELALESEPATPRREPGVEANPAAQAPPAEPAPVAEAAPDPEPQPSPESPNRAADGWFVQVGSFTREDNATAFRDKLRVQGYAAFVERAESEVQGKFYRVKVGPEAEKPRALKLRDRIAADFGAKGLVVGAD